MCSVFIYKPIKLCCKVFIKPQVYIQALTSFTHLLAVRKSIIVPSTSRIGTDIIFLLTKTSTSSTTVYPIFLSSSFALRILHFGQVVVEYRITLLSNQSLLKNLVGRTCLYGLRHPQAYYTILLS